MLESLHPEWHAPDLAELDKIAAQKRKEDAKQCITQQVEKRHNEKVTAKVRVAREAA